MNSAGITDRLIRLARAMVGHLPGGLGHVNVVVSMLFAGISGSLDGGRGGHRLAADPADEEGGLRRALRRRDHRLLVGDGRHHPALDPDGRLGRADVGLDRRAVPGGRAAGHPDRRVADDDASTSMPSGAAIRSMPRSTFIELMIAAGQRLAGADDAADHRRRHRRRLLHADRGLGRRRALLAGPRRRRLPHASRLRALPRILYDSARFAAISLFCIGTASAFGWCLAYFKIPQALVDQIDGDGPRASSAPAS